MVRSRYAESSLQLMYTISTTQTGPAVPRAGLSEACQDFLHAMFALDPRARPDCSALLLHPWIKEPTPTNSGASFTLSARQATTFVRDHTERGNQEEEEEWEGTEEEDPTGIA